MKNYKKNLTFLFLTLAWIPCLQVMPVSSTPNNCKRFIDGAPKSKSIKQPLNCELTTDLSSEFDKSFYKYGFNYEESQNPVNQFFNLFGISFKNGLNLSYPEQRIAYDGHHLWKNFNILLEEQFLPNSIYTEDISNGYTGSIGEGH